MMHVLGEALPEFLAGMATVAVTALFRWTRARLRSRQENRAPGERGTAPSLVGRRRPGKTGPVCSCGPGRSSSF